MLLDKSKEYLRQIYLGDLELARENLDNAKAIWNAVFEDDGMGKYEAGERFNWINEYDGSDILQTFKKKQKNKAPLWLAVYNFFLGVAFCLIGCGRNF